MVKFLIAPAIAIAAIGLVACSPSQAGNSQNLSADAPAQSAQANDDGATKAPDLHPVSLLDVIDLVVISGDKRHEFRVEHADTAAAQARGLMFRTELGDNEGMLFPSQVPTLRSFWMKNTPLSLDIIFIGVDGRISNIAANTVPYSLDSVSSIGQASAVLELRAGRAAQLGISAGDRVEYTLPY